MSGHGGMCGTSSRIVRLGDELIMTVNLLLKKPTRTKANAVEALAKAGELANLAKVEGQKLDRLKMECAQWMSSHEDILGMANEIVRKRREEAEFAQSSALKPKTEGIAA